MRVARIIPETLAEGPGRRFSIWVQGCGHHCAGCFAHALWDYEGGYFIAADDIVCQLEALYGKLDGIPLLGGEPFDQARELSVIAEAAHRAGKNVITFTGYTYEQLVSSDRDDWKALLSHTDLLIDGKYDKSRPETERPLAGSTNQRFLHLTDRIAPETVTHYKNRFEIRLDEKGSISFNGMGNINKLLSLLKQL